LLPLGFAFVAGKQADHRGVLGVFSRPMMPKAGFLEVPFSPDAWTVTDDPSAMDDRKATRPTLRQPHPHPALRATFPRKGGHGPGGRRERLRPYFSQPTNFSDWPGFSA
ncbi:hypothetical protein, partial [Xanthomonas sacchari]|uniref:hypothetical protein n=1 Tax=Xanthomonas sacchari TaxID=56458 RepID=UPI0022578B3E